MIDRVTSGIKLVYGILKARYFPMPDYDFSWENQVNVTIYGKILDINYTRILHDNPDLDLDTVFLLDKVQKGGRLTAEEIKILRKQKLIEGRAPKVFLSARVAGVLDERAKYIKNKGFDDAYYKDMIVDYLKQFGSGSRKDFLDLLSGKLPDILNEDQKVAKVKTLLTALRKANTIKADSENKRAAKWVLVEEGIQPMKNQ